nr:hypothetical protein [bacterium]
MIDLVEKRNTSLRYAPEAVDLFDKLLSRIGPESDPATRQRRMAELVMRLAPEEKRFLQKLIDGFLIHMREMDASDIEIGGSNCQQSIWLRIQGHKMARPEMGRWSSDQSDILVLSLLSQHQIERLVEHRVMDFSYEKVLEGRSVRWRAS